MSGRPGPAAPATPLPAAGAVFSIDKPAGWTSHDVVAKLRSGLRERRIGHAGTLDPDATGVLVVATGRATRLLRFLQDTTKSYTGTVRFGVATTTLDAAGEETERRAMPCTRAEVEEAAAGFVGEISQVPPMVSALKVGGRRLHELAREGVEVERAPRQVHIHRLCVVAFEAGEYPAATLEVDCSSGTYIRTLAADLGAALGGPAHLEALRRTRVGAFGLEHSHSIEAVVAAPGACMVAPLDALGDLARIEVDAEQAVMVSHGRRFGPEELLGAARCDEPGPWTVAHEGELLAVYERHRGALKPSVVLVP